MQVQMAKLQAETKLAEARAVADEGLGVERYSRVEENAALAEERRAAAVKDQDAGLLDLIKAIKELETIDLNHIQQLISMANMIKAQEAAANAAMVEMNKPAQPDMQPQKQEQLQKQNSPEASGQVQPSPQVAG